MIRPARPTLAEVPLADRSFGYVTPKGPDPNLQDRDRVSSRRKPGDGGPSTVRLPTRTSGNQSIFPSSALLTNATAMPAR